MSRTRSLLALGLATLGALSLPPAARAASPAAVPRFVFVGESGGQKDLFAAARDGTSTRNITRTPTVNEVQPSLSPLTNKVVFVREGEGIWVSNLNGSGLVQLTTNASDLEPAWFPDGSMVIFTRRQGDRDLWTMNADGTGQVRILDNSVDDETPDVSPDGQWIAFSAAPVGMFIMHPDGSGLQSLGSYFYCRKEQSWAPDSTSFAFTQCEFDGSSNIWVFDLVAFGSVQITPDARTESQPSWSPDGTAILYTKFLSGSNSAIFSIAPDGSNDHGITPTGGRIKESDPSLG